MKPRILVGAILLVPIGVLGWGYWHAATHGTVHVAVNDLGLKSDRQAYAQLRSAELAFLDAGSRVVATARIDEPLGIGSFDHPRAGDCRREEREGGEAWRACFQAHSRWYMTWAREARHARVKAGGCTIERAPVTRHEYGDAWWLWWVPVAHVGGKPYTSFSLDVWVDARGCRPGLPPT